MKRSGIFIAIGLFCLVSSCGDRDRQVEEALSLSGNNRNELEAVLKHYEGDGRKLEAARFLIGNMPGSYGANPIVEQDCSAFYEAYDSLGQKYGYRVGTEWGKQVDSLWKDFSNRHRVRQELNYDITRMKAEDLIREIDLAFRAWVENVHSRNCSFEDFCEYILPYRRQNGLSIDNARREFNKRHQGKYFVEEGKDWQQEIDSLLYEYKYLTHSGFGGRRFRYGMRRLLRRCVMGYVHSAVGITLCYYHRWGFRLPLTLFRHGETEIIRIPGMWC